MTRNKDKYRGMNALVTGASSGIGLEFSRQLAAKGINLLLVSNQPDELGKARDEISNKYPDLIVLILCKDLTEDNAAEELLAFCERQRFNVDILINDAGIFAFKEICDMPKSSLDLFISLHVSAVTHLCHIFANEMLKRGGGYILNMSSMSCWMPMPGIGMYAATKAYIRVLSRTMYLELKECGVSVTVACPGGIATDLFGLSKKLQRLAVRLGVLVTPEKFVKGALKAMFRRRKQYINGMLNRFSIFFVSIIPTRIRLIVKHKLLNKKFNG